MPAPTAIAPLASPMIASPIAAPASHGGVGRGADPPPPLVFARMSTLLFLWHHKARPGQKSSQAAGTGEATAMAQHDDPVAIFDGHNDSVQFIREYRTGGRDFLAGSADGHLDLPRARQGHLVGGLFALFAKPDQPPTGDFTRTPDGYEVRLAAPLDPAFARQRIAAQHAALQRLVDRSAGALRFATSVAGLDAARADGAFAIVLHMEGAEAIAPDLDGLQALYDGGLRSLGLVWSRPNAFGEGVPFAYPRSPDTGPGLSDPGRDLVRACNALGIMIDLAHLNERGFWDVAALSTAPLVATHACAHAVCASTRNLTDRQLDAIRDSGGVVGFNLCVNDVRPDAHLDADTPMDTVVRHLDYLVARLGEDHVALGSDFDGAVMPRPIGDAAGLPHLVAALRAHGFSRTLLEKIMLRNWLRVFRLTWRNSSTAAAVSSSL
jgi:membrane dipeptidase